MSADIKDPKTWYGLKLGEDVMLSNGSFLVRVPGGWILLAGNGDTFIPFCDEFDDFTKEHK